MTIFLRKVRFMQIEQVIRITNAKETHHLLERTYVEAASFVERLDLGNKSIWLQQLQVIT